MQAYKLSEEKGEDGRHVLSLGSSPVPAFQAGQAEALVRVRLVVA